MDKQSLLNAIGAEANKRERLRQQGLKQPRPLLPDGSPNPAAGSGERGGRTINDQIGNPFGRPGRRK